MNPELLRALQEEAQAELRQVEAEIAGLQRKLKPLRVQQTSLTKYLEGLGQAIAWSTTDDQDDDDESPDPQL